MARIRIHTPHFEKIEVINTNYGLLRIHPILNFMYRRTNVSVILFLWSLLLVALEEFEKIEIFLSDL